MARQFTSASSQYAENAVAVTTTLPLTIACWFYPDTSHTGTLLSIADNTAGNKRFNLDTRVTTNVLRAIHHDGTTNANADTTATYSTSAWNHAAAVFNGTADRTVYINGANKVNNTTSVTGSMASCNTTTLGRRSLSTPGNYFNGRLAEAALWNVALTDDEIASLYSARACPLLVRPTALLAYWPLVGRYAPEIDLRGAYDLTVTGATTADHVAMLYPAVPLILGVTGAAPPATNNPVRRRRLVLPEPNFEYSW